MADEDTHIFPFHTKSGVKPEKIDGLSSTTLILRGVVMEKKHFDPTMPLFLDNKRIEGKVFYWHPAAQKTDFIKRGMEMVREGLGFKPKSRLMENNFRNKQKKASKQRRSVLGLD